jgi:Skp family chaperone for outer membrane proteins
MTLQTLVKATFIAGVVALASSVAMAQDAAVFLPPATIGVIDSQFVMNNSEAAQDIRVQIEMIRDIYAEEIGNLENGLRAQEAELGRQRAILAQDAFDERLREFEGEVDRVQRLVEGRNDQLDRAFSEAMGKVRDALLQVVIEAAGARGFNMILEQSDILWAVVGLDITDDVMARLDEILPNVEVPVPID